MALEETTQLKCHVFEVWRLDDNGNEFLVDTFDDQESAERRIAALTASGHKQIYWVKEAAI